SFGLLATLRHRHGEPVSSWSARDILVMRHDRAVMPCQGGTLSDSSVLQRLPGAPLVFYPSKNHGDVTSGAQKRRIFMGRKKAEKDGYKAAMSRKTSKSVKKLEAEQASAEFEALREARAEYKEAGDPNSCGDAVALALKVFLHKVEGKSRLV